ADHRLFQQPDDGGEHLLAWEAGLAQVGRRALADARARLGALDQASVLHCIGDAAPARMVAVLFAAARVAAGRLNMAERIGTDPHIGPSRRDRERFDPLDLGAIGDRAAVPIDVTESPQRAEPADAGPPRRATHVRTRGP